MLHALIVGLFILRRDLLLSYMRVMSGNTGHQECGHCGGAHLDLQSPDRRKIYLLDSVIKPRGWVHRVR
jgi:hypothetical protein